VRTQRRKQRAQWLDRPASRTDIDADVTQPTVGVTEVVLHVDDNQRGSCEIERQRLRRCSDRDGPASRRTANQVDVIARHGPVIRMRSEACRARCRFHACGILFPLDRCNLPLLAARMIQCL
jgi:hypothetical protein